VSFLSIGLGNFAIPRSTLLKKDTPLVAAMPR
jgi:hypothetical protein